MLLILRGSPGLGRVAPGFALWKSLAPLGCEALFLTYGPGYEFLAGMDAPAVDLGIPESMFLAPLTPPFEKVMDCADAFAPDCIVVDGEPNVLPYLKHLGARLVFLANPHDLLGRRNYFRRVHRVLVEYADDVVVPSLEWLAHAREADDLYCVTPPFVRPRPREAPPRSENDWLENSRSENGRSENGRRRVLVSLGGGVIRGGEDFRRLTGEMRGTVLEALASLSRRGEIETVEVFPVAGLPAPTGLPDGFVVHTAPRDLLLELGDSDLLVTRAGRNTVAELAYFGLRGLVLPTAGDPLRGGEQMANADWARQFANIKVAMPDAGPEALEAIIAESLLEKGRRRSAPFIPGNILAIRKLFGIDPQSHLDETSA